LLHLLTKISISTCKLTLAEVIAAARESGISRHFILAINGSLLHRADDAI
jgi:hypothetical protein